ncbi:hypothetical protein [Streptomyces sp. NPDC001221]
MPGQGAGAGSQPGWSANVSLLSERAKQSDDEANKAQNALWWPASSAVAEAAVSF